MIRIIFPLIGLFFSVANAANLQTLEEAAAHAEERAAAEKADRNRQPQTEKKLEPTRDYSLFKPEFGRKYWLKPVKEYLSLALEMYDRPDAKGRQVIIVQTEPLSFWAKLKIKAISKRVTHDFIKLDLILAKTLT